MNQAHWHLIINHVPVLGSLFAAVLLGAGMLGKNTTLVRAGLVAVLFMRLDRADRLVRLAAACGLFWLAILFTLTLADTLSRLANT